MLATSVAIIVFVVRARRHARASLALTTISKSRRRRELRDMKFAVTLVVLNMTFLVLNALEPVYDVVIFFGLISVDLGDWESPLDEFLLSFNCLFYAIEFYVQIGVNSLVREQFIDMVLFFSRRRRRSTKRNTSSLPNQNNNNNNNNNQTSL